MREAIQRRPRAGSSSPDDRMLYHTPHKYECATDDVHLLAVLLTLDVETGKAVGIERIFYPEFETTVRG